MQPLVPLISIPLTVSSDISVNSQTFTLSFDVAHLMAPFSLDSLMLIGPATLIIGSRLPALSLYSEGVSLARDPKSNDQSHYHLLKLSILPLLMLLKRPSGFDSSLANLALTHPPLPPLTSTISLQLLLCGIWNSTTRQSISICGTTFCASGLLQETLSFSTCLLATSLPTFS